MKNAGLISTDQTTARWLEGILASSDLTLQSCSNFASADQTISQACPELIMVEGIPTELLKKFVGTVKLPVLLIIDDISVEQLSMIRQTGVAGFIKRSSKNEEVKFKVENVLHQSDGTRKNDRVLANFAVGFRIGTDNGQAKTYSISRDGIYVVMPQPPAINTEVMLRFTLPGSDQPISALAKVAYVVEPQQGNKVSAYPTGMALVFTNLNEDAKQTIDRFIESHAAG